MKVMLNFFFRENRSCCLEQNGSSKIIDRNDLSFIEGIDMGEDVLLTHRLFSLIPKVVHVPEAFVHYVKYNSKSYNGNISKKSLYDTFFG